jgi:hypothetical protein
MITWISRGRPDAVAPPRRHAVPDGLGRVREARHLLLERLRPWRPAPHDDAIDHGVSAALGPAHPAARLCAHSSIGISGEPLSRRTCRSGAHAARSVGRVHHDAIDGNPHVNGSDVVVPSLRRRDGPGPNPLRAPAQDDRRRFRFVMTGDTCLTSGLPVDVLTPTSQESCLSISYAPLSVPPARRFGASPIAADPATSPDSLHPNVAEPGL